MKPLVAAFAFLTRLPVWRGPLREDDRDSQVSEVEGFISRGVAGIVLAPLDEVALAPPVAEAKRRNIPVVTTGTRFEEAFRIMQECNCPAVPVLDGARRLVGLLTPENVTELMMVQSALPRRRFA